jgi:apolipoprotein N-acyltransferase
MIQKIFDFQTQNKPFLFHVAWGAAAAIFFSAFLYLEHYGIGVKLLHTLFGLFAFALLLTMPKRSILVAGFFIGIFWFYWIGYSFEYTGMGFITPLITLAFGLIYMLFFGVLALTERVWLRALLLFLLSFIEPFDFNWMQIELLFIESYIGIEKHHLFIVLASLALVAYMPRKLRVLPLTLLVFALQFSTPIPQEAPLKIKLVATDVKQEKKWLHESLEPTVFMIFREIAQASEEGYDVVVLPESVFPLFLNKNPRLIEQLQEFSYEISIVVGALLREDAQNYNVSYIFEDGQVRVAKKMVLVPFGEYIPLPKFAQDFINEIFFAGQADFSIAEEPSDFTLKGVKFRNAICYEATCQEIYEGDVRYVIAISNNAWFAPSIEPTLQNLLMRYYARKNGAVIYHSANFRGSGVVK